MTPPSRCVRRLTPVLIAFGMLLLLLLPSAAPATEGELIHIGMVKSIFRDIPDPVVKALLGPFGSLMQQATGINGQISEGGDALQLADQLSKGKLDLGVFHGFEFAWAQEKFPKLRPLMIAVNQQHYFAVHLITRDNAKISNFDELKGKKISLPCRSREHCYLFVDRHCEKANTSAEKYFSQIVKHANAEDGLDAVVRGDVDAVVVDGLTLDCYGTVKPGCLPLLRTVEKTPLFPAAVVAYREGALAQETLDAFSRGMLNANKSPKSRGLMTLWKLTAFEPVPEGYQQALETIRKAYPAPAAVTTKTAESSKAGSQ